MICKSTKNIEIHHIDVNCENNEEKNLTVLCENCHKKVRKGLVCYDYNYNCFIEHPFYKIWKDKNTIKIKSCYDQKLNKIIKSIDRFYWNWNGVEKYWSVKQVGFQLIQNKIIEHITSTGRKFEFPDWMKKIEDISKKLPHCSTEVEGYCNHAGEYIYGERIACTKIDCDDYFPAKD